MEIDWEKFRQVVEEKIDSKLVSITSKLDEQDKLISDLTNTIKSLIESTKPKANKLNLKSMAKPVVKEVAKKKESIESGEEKPAELTKDNSEENKDSPTEEA
ncbi:hypothetical protein SteCoe_12286 [Stentor coeruleus]|uniref:Uncharacterized protein n=1 Tax=Stentor coeruleus TaxID=5963 RepID=A0A1R2CB48_9CILI|nr:hypothetical protein SteCoe_12286 [Stentor coeruleus]